MKIIRLKVTILISSFLFVCGCVSHARLANLERRIERLERSTFTESTTGNSSESALFDFEEHKQSTLDSFQMGKFRLLADCQLLLEKGDGIEHTLLVVNGPILSKGVGTLVQKVEPGPKYRLKLRHREGIRAIFKLTWEQMKMVSSYNDFSKETSFFFRVTSECSGLENAL